MPESISKFLLALEALLIATPLTFLYLSIYFPRALFSSILLRSSVMGVLVLVISFVSLMAGWFLMVRFWRHGAAGLRTSPPAVWGAGHIGAASTVLATLLSTLGESMGWEYQRFSEIVTLVFAIPLLVPFGHLVAERFFRGRRQAPVSAPAE